MRQDVQSYVSELNHEYHRKKKWLSLIAVLSCITVFLTTYFMIMPAITRADDDYGDFESSDLSRFTTGITIKDIDGNTVDPENGTVFVGETYIFEVAFTEVNDIGNNHQFKYDDTLSPPAMTYQFDAGHMTIFAQQNLPITIQTDGQIFNVGHFDIDESGLVKVYFDDVTNTGEPTPDGTNFIDLYREVNFNLKFSVKVDADAGNEPISINLGKNIKVELINSPHGDLSIDKQMMNYDGSTHTLNYKVILQCTHGTVSDLVCTDVENIRDNQTGLINGIPMSAYENIVVKDLNGNYVGNDFSSLPDTLSRGEGYEITYSVPLDEDWYTSRARLSANSTNTFTVDATDSADEPLTKTATTSNHFDIANFYKTAYQAGTDGDKKIIHWTLYAGDGEHPLPNNIIVTDIVNQEQTFYTNLPAKWTILAPDGISPSTGTFTYGNDFVISGQHATINLPTGGAKYVVDYYTICDGGKTYTNDASINYNDWHTEGSLSVIDGECILTKKITNVDNDYISYQFSVTVPKERYGTGVWIRDRMNSTLNGGNLNNPNITFEPLDMVVTATDIETNTTVTLNKYDGTQDAGITYWTSPSTDTHKDFVFVFPDGKLPNQTTSWIETNTRWPFTADTRIDVSFRVKRDAAHDNTGLTVDGALAVGSPVTNTVCAPGTSGWQYARAPYSELPAVAKKGTSLDDRDATFQYRVAFTNNKSNPDSEDYWNKLTLLPENFSDMYLHDTFDERMDFVNGSMYALVYAWDRRQVHDLATTLGEGADMAGLLRGVFQYTGEDITGNTVNAKWTDFTGSNCMDYGTPSSAECRIRYNDATGVLETSKDWGTHWVTVQNLEELMQYAPDRYGVVFVYKTQLNSQYRVLTNAEITMEFDNTAYVDYQTTNGRYETNHDKATVTYDSKLLDKTFQTISGSDIVKYTILLNEHGVDLTENDFIVIEDTMNSSLTLYLETVKIQVGQFDSEENITWIDYDGNPRVAIDEISNTLALTLPDDCPVKVTYECKVSGRTGESVSLENSVTISGREAEIKTNQAVFEMSGSGGSGSAIDYYMYMLKKDIRTNQYLTDATFDLYGNNIARSADPDKTIIAHGETLYYYASYTTDENPNPVLNGTFRIDHTWLENNGHFAVVETVPPSGYELSSQILDFYWKSRPAGGDETVPVYENRMTYTYNDYPMTPELPATGGYGAGLLTAVETGCFFVTVVCLGYLFLAHAKRLKTSMPNPLHTCVERRHGDE